jgi:hypothetical protein
MRSEEHPATVEDLALLETQISCPPLPSEAEYTRHLQNAGFKGYFVLSVFV